MRLIFLQATRDGYRLDCHYSHLHLLATDDFLRDLPATYEVEEEGPQVSHSSVNVVSPLNIDRMSAACGCVAFNVSLNFLSLNIP